MRTILAVGSVVLATSIGSLARADGPAANSSQPKGRPAPVAVAVPVPAPVAVPVPAPVPVPVAVPAAVAVSGSAFEQGVALQERGKFGAALAAFRRAYAEEETPMSALHIAECEVGLGHLLAAHDILRAILKATIPDGSPPAFADAQQQAEAELAKLTVRVPRIRVTLFPTVSDALVTVDGVVQVSMARGDARRFDPGTHVIVAATHDREPVQTVVTVNEGDDIDAKLILSPISATSSTQLPVWIDEDRRTTELSSPALLGGGIAMTSLGGLGLIAALLSSNGGFTSRSSTQTGVIAIALVSGVLILAGIPMMIVGAHRVPIQQSSSSALWTPPSPNSEGMDFSFTF